MEGELLKLVEKEVANTDSLDLVKQRLVQKGFLEEDVEDAIKVATGKRTHTKEKKNKELIGVFTKKEILDRVGYGFVPNQFISILFFLTGANYFWLGTINSAKSILSGLISTFFQEYSKVRTVPNKLISWSGYLFGFSFIGMAAATLAKSVPLFAFFLLLGAVGIGVHGDLYTKLVHRHLKRERMGYFLARISHYGVLIAAGCMLFSGWLLDKFPIVGVSTITMGGKAYPLWGYLISFEVTAIAFILSGYVITKVKEAQEKNLSM